MRHMLLTADSLCVGQGIDPQRLVGPHLGETLSLKMRKLSTQLSFSSHPLVKKWLDSEYPEMYGTPLVLCLPMQLRNFRSMQDAV